MTIAERNNKLKQFITCLKCEVSGKPCNGNCKTNYEAGNIGEIIENLEAISKALEQEPTTRNCFGCKYSKDNHNAGTEECHLCMWENQYAPIPKNDLGVDCISREQALKELKESAEHHANNSREEALLRRDRDIIIALPSVTPQ